MALWNGAKKADSSCTVVQGIFGWEYLSVYGAALRFVATRHQLLFAATLDKSTGGGSRLFDGELGMRLLFKTKMQLKTLGTGLKNAC